MTTPRTTLTLRVACLMQYGQNVHEWVLVRFQLCHVVSIRICRSGLRMNGAPLLMNCAGHLIGGRLPAYIQLGRMARCVQLSINHILYVYILCAIWLKIDRHIFEFCAFNIKEIYVNVLFISFQEFTCDVSVEGGKASQPLQFSFTFYDLDGHHNGQITKDVRPALIAIHLNQRLYQLVLISCRTLLALYTPSTSPLENQLLCRTAAAKPSTFDSPYRQTSRPPPANRRKPVNLYISDATNTKRAN